MRGEHQRRAAGRAGGGWPAGGRGRRCGASLSSASSPGAWGAGPGPAAERPPRLARPPAAATATAAWTAPGGDWRLCPPGSAPSHTHCESGRGPGRAGSRGGAGCFVPFLSENSSNNGVCMHFVVGAAAGVMRPARGGRPAGSGGVRRAAAGSGGPHAGPDPTVSPRQVKVAGARGGTWLQRFGAPRGSGPARSGGRPWSPAGGGEAVGQSPLGQSNELASAV